VTLPKKQTPTATPVITVGFLTVGDDVSPGTWVVARATVPAADRASLALAFRICQEVAEATGWICSVEQFQRKLFVELNESEVPDGADMRQVLHRACERAVQLRTAHPLGMSTHTVEVHL
jgi:hypothetical protein